MLKPGTADGAGSATALAPLTFVGLDFETADHGAESIAQSGWFA
jgi:hypothetical protein